MSAPRVAIVGATGMVGRELLAVLERRRFPLGRLFCFSSGESRKSVRFRGREISCPGIDRALLASCDLVFFVSADEVSERLAPGLAKKGVWVIDDSAAFRLDPAVPLVIPEVNADALASDKRLIAGPNCTMAPVAVAGAPLHRRYRAVEARIASYQAVSGAGRAALEELFAQNSARARSLVMNGRAPALAPSRANILPRTIAFNVIPQVGSFDAEGYSSEERKVAAELRKVWGAPRLKVSVTAARVPTIRGHALSAWLTFSRPLSPRAAQPLLRRAPGLEFSADDYPTPLSAGGKDAVFAGRLRQGATPRELCLWVVGDNLLKGAALNSVQIAESLLARRWLSPRAGSK